MVRKSPSVDKRVEEELDKALVGHIFQATNPRTPCPFLDLALELRHGVYELLVSIDVN